MKICERVKEIRTDNKLTATEMADILKIDRANYSKYESGKLEFNNQMLLIIAKHFNVSMDYLFGLED